MDNINQHNNDDAFVEMEESSDEEDEDDDELLNIILNENNIEDFDDLLHFPGYTHTFNLFRNDREVVTLSFLEKEMIFEYLFNNNNILRNESFTYLKEFILKTRALNNPLIKIKMIKKMIMVQQFNAELITKNLQYYFTPTTDKPIIKYTRHFSEKEEIINKFLYSEQQPFYDIETEETNILSLPSEILERILALAVPQNDLNIIKYFDMRLTCKAFHKIMKNSLFTKKVAENLHIYTRLTHKYNNLSNVSDRVYNNLVYEYIHNLFKNYYLSVFGPQIIVALGGFNSFFKLQFLDMIDYKCIDNVCGFECCQKYHNLHHLVNSPISKGIDNKGRQFLLFYYKTANDIIYYEFIYNNNLQDKNYFSYSGYNLNTFIGNLSVDYSEEKSACYRTIYNRSFTYIKKLVEGTANKVEFTDNLDKAYEIPNKPVKLFFDRAKIEAFVTEEFKPYLSSFIRYTDQSFTPSPAPKSTLNNRNQ